MSDMELKHDDLIDFSKMCVPEYNMPQFSDRVLMFDVMRDNWVAASYAHSSVTTELDVAHSHDSVETCGDKRSLEISDEEPEQKRMKKIEANEETPVEVSVADCGSEIQPTCEQANIGEENETEGEFTENMRHELSCDQAGNKQVGKPSISPPHLFTSSESQKAINIDPSETQENLNETLRQHKIYVHGVWLAVQSPYFRSLLYSSGMKETHDTEVHLKIPESEENAHLVLLEAMYRNEVLNDKSVDEVLDVLELADKYDVKFVFKKCKYVLQQNATTFEISTQIMHVIKVKHDMNDVEDLAATLQLVLAKEFSPLDENWQSEKFTTLSEPSLKYLLSSDDLIVQSENTVFHALMYWIEHSGVDPTALEETNDLLAVVRFKLVTIDYLYNVIKSHPIASKMPKFNELYSNGMTYHAIPPKQKKLLQEQPVLRKKPERNIIQQTFLAKDSGACCDTFWACGYQMSVNFTYRSKTSGLWSSYYVPSLNIHNLNKESSVPLRFMITRNKCHDSLQQETFDLNSCKKDYENTSISQSAFNGNGCQLFVILDTHIST